jgi:hypothetical protein
MALNKEMLAEGDEHEQHWSTQVRVRFANGIEASILTDGYGGDRGRYEVMLTSEHGAIHHGSFGTDETGIIGWLDGKQLGELLTKAAAAKLQMVPGFTE